MLGVILSCYREFEERITVVEKAGNKSTSYDIVKAYVSEKIGNFRNRKFWFLAQVWEVLPLNPH